jgi:hypothetical protein
MQGQGVEMVKQLERVYLDSIREVFNESLTYERPFGIEGQQPIWVPDANCFKNRQIQRRVDLLKRDDPRKNSGEEAERAFMEDEDEIFEQILGRSIARIIQWGSCLCGFIPESLELERHQQQQI